MFRFVKFAAVLLLSLSLGLHWAVLQSVAWTSMLVERTQASSFNLALKSTFDGQHPCKLCEVVRAGEGSEKKPATNLKPVKLELPLAGRVVLFPLRAPARALGQPSAADWSARSEVPPVPPPRG